MNELQRRAYLQAMEVDYYIPRLQLPGAMPSVLCAMPAVVDAVEPLPLNPATAKQLDNAGASRVAALQAMLGEKPLSAKNNDRISSPTDPGSPIAVAEQRINPESIPQFSLTIIHGQNLLIIDEGLQGHINPSEYLQLLQNILFAIGAGKQALSIDTFVWPWPMAKQSSMDQSGIAARQALASFLSKQISQLQVRHILLMGDTAAGYITEQKFEAGVLHDHPSMPVQLIRTHSAGLVLSDASLKSELWQQLNALLMALK